MEATTLAIASGSEDSASSSEALSAMISLMDGTVMELTEMAGMPKKTSYKTPSIDTQKRPLRRGALSLPSHAGTPCWETKNCPTERRNLCPAYPTQGNKCWMVTGTQCGGITQGSFSEKMANCRKCNVFQAYN
jgi:methyl-accepting chemotaxis protein